MRVNPKLRAALLIGALALTLAAVRWADKLTDMNEASAGAVAEATPRAHPRPAPATGQPAPALDLGKLRRAPVVDPNGDPFGARSFRPAPPKAKTGPSAGALQRPPNLHRRRRRFRLPISVVCPKTAIRRCSSPWASAISY